MGIDENNENAILKLQMFGIKSSKKLKCCNWSARVTHFKQKLQIQLWDRKLNSYEKPLIAPNSKLHEYIFRYKWNEGFQK